MYNLKIRFLTIFLASFVILFAVLNGRFVVAYGKFWLFGQSLTLNIPSQNSTDGEPLDLPVVKEKRKVLPNTATLVIDKIGITAPIVFNIGTDTKSVYNNLENGVVHYSSTPKPGLEGVSVVLGHSSAYPWYKGSYGSVFALLSQLQPGDKFYVQYEDGQTFTFAVKGSLIFNPFAGDDRLKELEKNPKPSLVLLSCWPVGTDYKRIAVQAELI